jgi:hypothetical protein
MEEATILPQDEIKKEADIEEEERKYWCDSHIISIVLIAIGAFCLSHSPI